MAVAILHPGSMGSSLALAIHDRSPDIILYTCLTDRSPATISRAQQAGLRHVELKDLVAKSTVIISILPPSEAFNLAQEIARMWSYAGHQPGQTSTTAPIYIDANAISPSTTHNVSAILAEVGIPFVDGSVIGGPYRQAIDRRSGYDPRIYLSAAKENEATLDQVYDLIGGDKGLDLHLMRGAGIGAASALKMSYAGLTKGMTGLVTAMVLSASKHSPTTAQALINELKFSQPAILTRATATLETMLPKAYRWIGEMEEIADYVDNPTGLVSSDTVASISTLDTSGMAVDTPTHVALSTATAATTMTTISEPAKKKMSDTYRGIAAAYENIARDLENGGEGDVRLLQEWIKKGTLALKGD